METEKIFVLSLVINIVIPCWLSTKIKLHAYIFSLHSRMANNLLCINYEIYAKVRLDIVSPYTIMYTTYSRTRTA